MKKMFKIEGNITIPVECCVEATNKKQAVVRANKGFKDILRETEIVGKNDILNLEVDVVEEINDQKK